MHNIIIIIDYVCNIIIVSLRNIYVRTVWRSTNNFRPSLTHEWRTHTPMQVALLSQSKQRNRQTKRRTELSEWADY